ncbi:MAG: hypothetical protein ABIO69_05840 [Sphingomicrobium sp.]
MLYQELPPIDVAPLNAASRWLTPALVGGAALTIGLFLLAGGYPLAAALFAAAGVICVPAVMLLQARSEPLPVASLSLAPDYAVIGSALGLSRDPAAVTNGEGSLLIANIAYRDRFGGACPPLTLGVDEDSLQSLRLVKSMAWRDGGGCVAGVATASGSTAVEVERVGSGGDLLLWGFPEVAAPDPMMVSAKRLAGPIGERLASAGLLAALVDEDGMLIAANRSFASRAVGLEQEAEKLRFADLVEFSEDGQVHLLADGESARPMQ